MGQVAALDGQAVLLSDLLEHLPLFRRPFQPWTKAERELRSARAVEGEIPLPKGACLEHSFGQKIRCRTQLLEALFRFLE